MYPTHRYIYCTHTWHVICWVGQQSQKYYTVVCKPYPTVFQENSTPINLHKRRLFAYTVRCSCPQHTARNLMLMTPCLLATAWSSRQLCRFPTALLAPLRDTTLSAAYCLILIVLLLHCEFQNCIIRSTAQTRGESLHVIAHQSRRMG